MNNLGLKLIFKIIIMVIWNEGSKMIKTTLQCIRIKIYVHEVSSAYSGPNPSVVSRGIKCGIACYLAAQNF